MVARYEDLRHRGANEGAGGLGRALLMGRGMAAWMEAWRHSVPTWDRKPREESGKGLERADASAHSRFCRRAFKHKRCGFWQGWPWWWLTGDNNMNLEAHEKVSAEQLNKEAYLYVRQSTLRQVVENTESTERQYALRQRAIALGWPDDRIVVIDSDLGQSGATAADREGFQRLVTEVGMGRAGLVMGLEVSRLARNSSDWHRLLEICALSGTLILD
jgi:hypothetical protein